MNTAWLFMATDVYTRAPEHEKRLLARVNCFLSTEVWWPAKDEKRSAFITNLSLGACYVTTTSPLPLKSRVRIALWLDDEAKTWSDGIVISSHRDVGMEIKFLGLSVHNQDAVERCIEAQKDRGDWGKDSDFLSSRSDNEETSYHAT